MGIFQIMLLVHLLYDFHIQGDFIGRLKGSNDFLLIVHCLTWALLLSVVLDVYGIYEPWKLFFLSMTHYLIDYWKSHKLDDDPRKLTTWLYIDQLLHLITILIVINVSITRNVTLM